jgi:hypothetical protein
MNRTQGLLLAAAILGMVTVASASEWDRAQELGRNLLEWPALPPRWPRPSEPEPSR